MIPRELTSLEVLGIATRSGIDSNGGPPRVYTMSHIEYVLGRLDWLYGYRHLVRALKFVEEPPVLRFLFEKLKALDIRGAKLAQAFKKESGSSCQHHSFFLTEDLPFFNESI